MAARLLDLFAQAFPDFAVCVDECRRHAKRLRGVLNRRHEDQNDAR